MHQRRKRGMMRADIGEIVGVHADTAGCWLKLNEEHLDVNNGGRKQALSHYGLVYLSVIVGVSVSTFVMTALNVKMVI